MKETNNAGKTLIELTERISAECRDFSEVSALVTSMGGTLTPTSVRHKATTYVPQGSRGDYHIFRAESSGTNNYELVVVSTANTSDRSGITPPSLHDPTSELYSVNL